MNRNTYIVKVIADLKSALKTWNVLSVSIAEGQTKMTCILKLQSCGKSVKLPAKIKLFSKDLFNSKLCNTSILFSD